MSDKTGIEWTDATWNPIVGCSKVSPGCDNCYAISMSRRIEATGNKAYEGITTADDWTGLVKCLPERLDQPLRWRRPRRIFVNSMSDMFHPDVPEGFIFDIFDVMAEASRHQFQILTKRPRRMALILERFNDFGLGRLHFGSVVPWPLPNVWLGTSIELDRHTFRAGHLARAPAAVRFLSLEPLLGPLPSLDLTGIDWVIVGGESGPRARPMHPDWVRDLRDACTQAGPHGRVPFFFKQWGEWEPGGRNHKLTQNRFAYPSVMFQPDGTKYDQKNPETFYAPGMASLVRVGKKAAGRTLDGRTWDEMPDHHPAEETPHAQT